MKLSVCIYANCQGAGMATFLRRARHELNISVFQNYRMMLAEENPEQMLNDLADCDVFVFQPTDAFECKGGGQCPSTDSLCKLVPDHCIRISFPYSFNSGFFPIVKSGKWWTGDDVFELGKGSDWFDVVTCYDRNLLNFDCARRFAENLAEQSRRERGCTIKLAPFILENFQTSHLFLLHNHPASALLAHLAEEVLALINPKWSARIPFDGPTDGGRLTAVMPGYHSVHQAVIKELGLTFTPDRTGEDAVFYRTLIEEFAATKGIL